MTAEAESPLAPGLAEIMLRLHEDSPLLVALFDEHDRLRHANPAWRQAYFIEAGAQPTWAEIMRDNHAHKHGAAIDTDHIEAWIASISARRGKTPFRAFEADLCDGRWLWMTETVQAQGWMLCIGSEITSLRQDSRALRMAHTKALAAAQTDNLTGLSNRRHGMQLLQDALNHTELWPICVAAIDLDHFKQINDSLGHAAGDRVICDFASQMQAGSRREDGCARIGGEEFLLILPAAGLPQAQAIVERLLSRVRQSRPLPEHPDHGYTCSAGLAQAIWGETAEALLGRADKALYLAKAEGRNRIAIAPE